MSDFDKEAEREKLREKYEQDQAEREVAEKMSELLLQGATMTNAHCSECGDPIFRYDGQEFCATCEKAVDRDTGEDGDEGDEGDDSDIEVTTPDEEARVQFGADGETAPEQSQQAQQPQQPRRSRQPAESQPEQPQSDQPPQQSGQPQGTEPTPSRQRQPDQPREMPRTGPSSGADVSAARDSLVRTLTRFSQQAEATDDPQRASEYLAAAREAAETLSALRQ